MNKKYFIGSVNITLTIITSFLLLIGYNTKYVISNTKIIIILTIITTLSIIIIKSYFTRKKNIYNLVQFTCFLLNLILIYNIYNINTYNKYIENIITNKYEYKVYNIYVLKNTKYDNLKELENKKVGFLKSNESNIKKTLTQKGKYNFKTYTSIREIERDINNGIIQSFISDTKIQNDKVTTIESIKIPKTKLD